MSTEPDMEPRNDNPEDLLNETINVNVENEVNQPITEAEILKSVKSLKNNKASGEDNIVNEHIKSTIHLLLPIYCKLFNIILDTGIIPETWSVGVIKPIYKNKGDPKNAENYRPITLLSCFGKLFTSIINNRLNDFAEKGTSRQRSGKGAIRKRFPLQKPRWEKTKLTIRHPYHETYRKPNEQLFSQ